MLKNLIIENIENPVELERLYRSDPEGFRDNFQDIIEQNPESMVLQVWKARLESDAVEQQAAAVGVSHNYLEIGVVILLVLISGTLVRIPSIFDYYKWGESQWWTRYFEKNWAFFVFPALATYFLYLKKQNRKVLAVVAVSLIGAAVFMNLLPEPDPKSDTFMLSTIHVPFFLWAITGIAFAGHWTRHTEKKMEYLRYFGEIVIYTLLILLGGIVLSGLTFALFFLIGIVMGEWYFEYVILYGSIAAPLVGIFVMERVSKRGFRFAPILARMFTPLFLVTFLAFLVTLIVQKADPYTDREFLIVFNIALLIVLAIVVFSISERRLIQKIILSDYLNASLVFVAIVIDSIALSAIIFRLTSYGLTPNRIAVLGANILIFANLIGILFHYARYLMGRAKLSNVESWISDYLPIYTIWTAFVAFVFPWIYSFQ